MFATLSPNKIQFFCFLFIVNHPPIPLFKKWADKYPIITFSYKNLVWWESGLTGQKSRKISLFWFNSLSCLFIKLLVKETCYFCAESIRLFYHTAPALYYSLLQIILLFTWLQILWQKLSFHQLETQLLCKFIQLLRILFKVSFIASSLCKNDFNEFVVWFEHFLDRVTNYLRHCFPLMP